MTLYKYENNAADTLNGSIDASQITITLNDASEFPVIGAGEAYWITVTDGINLEIMLVTDDASTPTLTVTRGQQGTSGTAFADASPVAQRLTKGFFEDALQADESPELRGTLTAPSGTGIDAENADSLKVPTSSTFAPVAAGEVGIDDTVTDWSHGVMQYYSGEAVGVVAMPIAQFTSPTDGYVVAYNATNDEFELVAQSGGGGGDLVDDLTPQLGGFLDLNGNFIGHATSGATAYSIVSDGTGLATYGANANYVHAFTTSGWSIQWGTTFNRMEFDISTDMRVYTNNVLRYTINDSGLTLGATTAVSGILDEDTMSSDSATDLATQQSIKAYVDDSVNTLTSFRAQLSSNQNITNNTWTKCTLATENFDTGGMFDHTTNYRFTPTVAGIYFISALVNWNTPLGANALMQTSIYFNGVAGPTVLNASPGAATYMGLNISDFIEFNGTTDYVELYIYQATGATAVALASTSLSGSLMEKS